MSTDVSFLQVGPGGICFAHGPYDGVRCPEFVDALECPCLNDPHKQEFIDMANEQMRRTNDNMSAYFENGHIYLRVDDCEHRISGEAADRLVNNLLTARHLEMKHAAETKSDYCYAKGDEGAEYCGDPEARHHSKDELVEFRNLSDEHKTEHLVRCMRDDHLIHHEFVGFPAKRLQLTATGIDQ